FGDFILSFNSNDNLASSIASAYPQKAETFQTPYSKWLSHYASWIHQCVGNSKAQKGIYKTPIFCTIKDNQDVFSGCGIYMTSVLLACAGIQPWTPTIGVISCPSRTARLAEALFKLVLRGHNANYT
ncbi:hypothetical protein MPER_15153, partial [Moniliophthora perniciosa FA553]